MATIETGRTDDRTVSHGGKARADDKAERPKSTGRPYLIMGLILLVAIGVAVFWWLRSRNVESTDDAYVDASIVRLSPQASGQIVQLLVTDNQRVRQGQLLAVIDTSVIGTERQQAEAVRAEALAQIAQVEARVKVSEAQLLQARAGVEGPAADAAKAQRDYSRFLGAQSDMTGAVAGQDRGVAGS